MIVLLTTIVSLEEPNPNGFSTTPMPTVELLFTKFLRIVKLWAPTLRSPLPEGSSCRSSKNSSTQPGGVPGAWQTGGKGFGRLFLCTTLPSMSAVSVEDVGRLGRTITK